MAIAFLEYFCGWAFVWQFEKERIIDLEYLKAEVFGKHWQDESWHEVLRLIAGMLNGKFVGEIIEFLMGQKVEHQIKYGLFLKKASFLNLLLAAECVDEVKNRSAIAHLAEQLLEQLKAVATGTSATGFSFQYRIDSSDLNSQHTL